MRSLLRTIGLITSLAALAACGANGGSVAPASSNGLLASLRAGGGTPAANVVRACPPSADPSIASCMALVRTDVGGGSSPYGYGPSELQSAYELPSAKDGKGQTLAVVDAYDDPNAASDLAVYRAQFGLPACNSSNPCFEKYNEEGQQSNYPQPNSGWAVEESLDLDMSSAICPNCTIILVEASSSNLVDLGKSVDEAVKLGANTVSNSYGNKHGKQRFGARYYDHPGTIITASAGDSGYGVTEPAGYSTVVAVGGTSLTASSGSRGWTETVWGGTGSGCERLWPKPSWQKDTGCKARTMNDVAAVADPNTGVAVYDTYPSGGWFTVGGTSVSSPLVAAIFGLAGNASKLNAAQSLYKNASSLWDVTSGNNGACKVQYLCNAGPGYDGPTGNGTPHGIGAF